MFYYSTIKIDIITFAIEEIETACLENAPLDGAITDDDDDENSNSKALDFLKEQELNEFIEDLDEMMKDAYRWWKQNNKGKSSFSQEFDALYEWSAQEHGGDSWWEEVVTDGDSEDIELPGANRNGDVASQEINGGQRQLDKSINF